MYYYSIFQQLFKFIPRYRFEKSLKKLSGDRYCKRFSAWQQFLTCLYAQITGKDSLREIASGLATNQSRLYHLGMTAVAKSTLADAMNRRSPDIFKALFEELLDRSIACAPKHGFKFHNPLHAIDSTTIDLCLSQYDWAHYRKHKGAIKLHTELDLSGNIPCFVVMSNGKMSDIRAAKQNVVIVPDSIYTFDKGYYDLNWFQQIANAGAFFVTRIKSNAQFMVLGQHRPPNAKLGIRSDEIIEYTGILSMKKFPGKLRLVKFFDDENEKVYRFITNKFDLAASTIAGIYKRRWQIELFFKWIKQNLKIKSFLGTSENAVMTQIWVGLILLVEISTVFTPFFGDLSLISRMAGGILSRIKGNKAGNSGEKKMPENAWGMSDDELLVANHIYRGFNKVPCKISVYAAEDNVRKVCFLSAPQPDGIVHIGTVGTFHRTMMGQPDGEEKFRVELVSSVRERFVDVMSDLLSFLCFCLDNQKFYYHCGAPLQDIFEHACYKKPRISVRHIVFCKPETFGLDLPDLTVQGETVKFLYVLPITDQELSFYRENGLPALVEQLKGGIDFRDLKRKPTAFADSKKANSDQWPDSRPALPEGKTERSAKMGRKKFSLDELKATFRSYTLDGEIVFAVNPDPEMENRLAAFALAKNDDGTFTVIAKTVIPAASLDEEVEFWGKEGVGEIQLPRLGASVRYDFQAHEWIFVSWRRWSNAEDVHPDPDKAPHLPATFAEILRDYFPKGKRKENYWRTFTARNGDDFWDVAENGDADSAFVVEAKDGQCIVYACLSLPDSIKILSAFFIPKDYGFPLRFRLNFKGNTGAFCVNGKLYGTYDFDALTGEALL